MKTCRGWVGGLCVAATAAACTSGASSDAGPIDAFSGPADAWAGPPLELATGLDGPFGIDVGADHVYFTSVEGTIRRARKDGTGDTETLVSGYNSPSGVVVDGDSVFFGGFTDGVVAMVPSTGGDATIVAANLDGPIDVALDDTHVYWTLLTGDKVQRAPREGGTIETLAETADGVDRPYGLVVVGDTVYFANDGAEAVWRVSITGGDAEEFAPNQPGIFYVDSDGEEVFWTSLLDARVRSKPMAGGDVLTLAAADTGGPIDVSVVGGLVYYTNFDEDSVSKVPVGGGNPALVIDGQDGPWGLAADDSGVYFTNRDGGTIVRAPR